MTTSLSELVESWTTWLNTILADPSLPLHAHRSPFDVANDQGEDRSATATTLRITCTRTRNIPAMVGLLSSAPPHEDDDGSLANEVYQEQICSLQSAGPFFCFIAHGKSKITFYYCEDESEGSVEVPSQLDVTAAYSRSFERGGTEQDGILRAMLMDGVTANLAQVTRAAMARSATARSG